MARWGVWLNCIGKAVAQKGLQALAGMVPFGQAIYAIGAAACEMVKKAEQREEDRRILLQEMLQASDQQIRQAAEEAARQAAAGLSAEVRDQLAIYLMQVPAVARQSLRRPEDPTGTSVPAGRSMSRPEDVLPLLPTRTPRFKIGDRPLPGVDWELEQLLGVGGFGEVWKARNPHFDGVTPVALKFCLDPDAKERLLGHEAAVLNQVMRHGHHPGIVALRHTYLSADPPCLEYEYVAGGDLATWIQQCHQHRPVDLVQRVLRVMVRLAKIIAFAHQLNPPIVHRDLKPANILLQPQADGTCVFRVADFGIGGVAAEQALRQTKSGLENTPNPHFLNSFMLGSYTPLYASPQQMRGAKPDPRDDVHALGVIGYQMLTGQLSQGIGSDFVNDLQEVGADNGLIDFVGRCTAQKAERRPKDAIEVTELLKKLDPYIDVRIDVEDYNLAEYAGKIKAFLETRAATRMSRWKDAAQMGSSCAQFLYGACFGWGIGVARDDSQEAAWYGKAAEQGHSSAQFKLAAMCDAGRGVSRDNPQALVWYRKAAEQGHAEAQVYLGVLYAMGRGVPKDYEQAAAWYRKAAEQGSKRGQAFLARACSLGRGVPRSDEQAVEWFRKAAEQGDSSAQYGLAEMYRMGCGVARDEVQAAAYYLMAAEHGDRFAQYRLGKMYSEGRGVARDDLQAVAWYQKAADNGHSEAQYTLGWMYDYGRGVAKDHEKAVTWYGKAAEQGDNEALCKLGDIYARGRGIPKDYEEARSLYHLAAEQGYARAQYSLADIYRQDAKYAKAAAWYRRAAEQGDEDAKLILEDIADDEDIKKDLAQVLDLLENCERDRFDENARSLSPKQRGLALEILDEDTKGCARCADLCSTRNTTVFGQGKPGVELCFVGEAPSQLEDAEGLPFVGPAGKMFDLILQASGLKRDEVYICNILKCRPPGNRTPLTSETDNCQDYLTRQLQLVRPKLIISLGGCATSVLLNTKTPLAELRGRFHEYKGIPVLVTYHPASLLPGRHPENKILVWEDMKLILTRLGRPIPGKPA